VIRYKGRIWLGNNKPVQFKVLHALHASPVGGHSGAPVTYTRIKQLFFWPGLKTDVWAFVQNCATCIQAKPDRSRYPGLLQPLPVLASSFEVITMDFIEGLPQSGSFNAIWVVVDKFSKFSHFMPLKHPFTTASLAKVFMDQIYRLHGMPKVIISDRDRIFTSKLWQLLFKSVGSELRFSSSRRLTDKLSE
jgi:hypothetical protein